MYTSGPLEDLSLKDAQTSISGWMRAVFGEEVQTYSIKERVYRFIEEAAELAQALQVSNEEVVAVVNWVYRDKAPGLPRQEAAGVLVTLLGVSIAAGFSLSDAFKAELARINTTEVIERVRLRQAEKRGALAGTAADISKG